GYFNKRVLFAVNYGITSREIPKFQNNLQNNSQNSSSNFSHTINQVDPSYTANIEISLTEGGSSGFSIDGRSTPSNSLNAFQMSIL
ncbi:16328_t:CDS:1, partial [Cetraspora pellucida]